MTERKDIGWRLENWARFQNGRQSGGANCMTGAICDDMRKNSGLVHQGHDVRDALDKTDAMRIEFGMRSLEKQHRLMLYWCYIKNARPEKVCRELSIPVRPSSIFVELFRDAQYEIEQIVDMHQCQA